MLWRKLLRKGSVWRELPKNNADKFNEGYRNSDIVNGAWPQGGYDEF